MNDNAKQCPFCCEMIKKEAIKCKYCQSMLSNSKRYKNTDVILTDKEEKRIQEEVSDEIKYEKLSKLLKKKENHLTGWYLNIPASIILIVLAFVFKTIFSILGFAYLFKAIYHINKTQNEINELKNQISTLRKP